MMIQGSVNQLLTLAAAGARFMPGYETKQQIAKEQKKLKVLKGQEGAMVGAGVVPDTVLNTARLLEGGELSSKERADVEANLTEAQRTASEQESTQRRLFELDPTVENYNKLLKQVSSNIQSQEFFSPVMQKLKQVKAKAQDSLNAEQSRLQPQQ